MKQEGNTPCSLTRGMRTCSIFLGMRKPLSLRPLIADERQTLQEGLRRPR
jgi:hypothetical protein